MKGINRYDEAMQAWAQSHADDAVTREEVIHLLPTCKISWHIFVRRSACTIGWLAQWSLGNCGEHSDKRLVCRQILNAVFRDRAPDSAERANMLSIVDSWIPYRQIREDYASLPDADLRAIVQQLIDSHPQTALQHYIAAAIAAGVPPEDALGDIDL